MAAPAIWRQGTAIRTARRQVAVVSEISLTVTGPVSPPRPTPGGCLEEAARLMPAPLLGIAPRPIYLLPMLRMGVMSAIVTRES